MNYITRCKKKLQTVFALMLLLWCIPAQSQINQTDTVDLFNLSLDQLMNMEISVASKTAMTQQESPAIVSVVTKQEIQKSGARDLVDILRLVPGIEFGVDVQGAVGITMRGNWGHEGKVLLMIDNQEMNELSYSTVLYGNHYSVNNINHIEIIRGPGSSIYGGFAELGVINIITESGNDLKGLQATAQVGSTKNSTSPQMSISLGNKTDDFEFSVSSSYMKGNRSDRDYVDVYGDSYNMTDQSNLESFQVNTGLKYKDLSLRFIYDNYKTRMRDLYDAILSKDYGLDYASILGEVKYDWKISDKVTLTPKINYISNQPWKTTEQPVGDDLSLVYNRTVTKIRPHLSTSIDFSEKLNLLAGLEYFTEKGKISSPDEGVYYDNSTEISFNNFSAFAQAIYETDFVNTIVGVRGDFHSEFGSAFAPRIGFTKVSNKFHAKLLYSMAFRSPGIENINFNAYLNGTQEPNIKPENTQVIELEAGYKITPDMIITANIYNVNLDKTIVYTYDYDLATEGYRNAGKSGSQGFELEFKINKAWGYANMNYSYYSSKNINEVENYMVPSKESAMLGTPQHKISLNSSFNITNNFSINPTLTYLGERYAMTMYDEDLEDVLINKVDPITLLNLYFNYKNIFTKGLDVGFGAYNILDQDYDFIQPYYDWHAPYPGKTREFVAKISYKLDFE